MQHNRYRQFGAPGKPSLAVWMFVLFVLGGAVLVSTARGVTAAAVYGLTVASAALLVAGFSRSDR